MPGSSYGFINMKKDIISSPKNKGGDCLYPESFLVQSRVGDGRVRGLPLIAWAAVLIAVPLISSPLCVPMCNAVIIVPLSRVAVGTELMLFSCVTLLSDGLAVDHFILSKCFFGSPPHSWLLILNNLYFSFPPLV